MTTCFGSILRQKVKLHAKCEQVSKIDIEKEMSNSKIYLHASVYKKKNKQVKPYIAHAEQKTKKQQQKH